MTSANFEPWVLEIFFKNFEYRKVMEDGQYTKNYNNNNKKKTHTHTCVHVLQSGRPEIRQPYRGERKVSAISERS